MQPYPLCTALNPHGIGASILTWSTGWNPVTVAVMAQRKYEPGPAMTLGNMREQGVRNLIAMPHPHLPAHGAHPREVVGVTMSKGYALPMEFPPRL